VAAAIQTALQIEAVLVKGRKGVFDVSVDGEKVIGKTLDAFPTENAVVQAVSDVIAGR
jgi:predicted Rdx family selenoprotein